MGLQTVWTMAEASKLALKAELMEKFPQNFSYFRYSPRNNFESVGEKEKSLATRDSNLKNNGINIPSSIQQGKALVYRKYNPNVKSTGDTCNHCNGRGHRSNVCLTRRVIVVAEEMEEGEEKERHELENDKYAGVEFPEEESDERVNFVLQRVLLAFKDERQCKKSYRTYCSIKNNVCNLIVDSATQRI